MKLILDTLDEIDIKDAGWNWYLNTHIHEICETQIHCEIHIHKRGTREGDS